MASHKIEVERMCMKNCKPPDPVLIAQACRAGWLFT